jgi:N-methylhydantoinase A
MAQVRWLVAVDAGGALTDAVAFGPDGALRVAIGLDLSATDLIFHGTTVATNAMLNDRLARVVLLITEGFRDVLSYRNGTRAKVYDLEQPRPSQFRAPSRPVGGPERLSSQDDEVIGLFKEEIGREVQAVAERHPVAVAVAVAVSFLFSYLDDDHERMVADAITARSPDLPVTRSSAIAREFREYPRTSTAVVNAGLHRG